MSVENAKQYAENELAKRSALARERAAQYAASLNEKYPELASIDRRINDAGLAAALAAASGGNAEDASRAVAAPMAQRALFLKQHGITEKDFHFCNVCKDEGSIHGELCECYKGLVREYLAREINIHSPLKLCSFDSFSLSYYSDRAEDGPSDRDIMRENLAVCREFAQKGRRAPDNLLLLGYAGLGKTHLALSIANERILAGDEVIYCSGANIFRAIEREYVSDYRADSLLSSLKSCELLILDDLGSENLNPIVVNAVYDLVNTRVSECRQTVYTTNITERAKLEARYSESVASRLLGCCRLLAFRGGDIRAAKAAEQRL